MHLKRPGFFQVDSRSTRLSPGKSWPGVRRGRETQEYPGQKQAYPTSTRSRRTGTGKSQGKTRLPGRTCCVRKTPGFCQVRAPWQPAFNPAYARRKPGEKLSARSKTTFYLAFPLGFPRWMLGVPIHSDHACPPNFYLAFSRLPGSPAEADQLSPGFCQAGQLSPGFCQARFEWDLQSKSKESTMLH